MFSDLHIRLVQILSCIKFKLVSFTVQTTVSSSVEFVHDQPLYVFVY